MIKMILSTSIIFLIIVAVRRFFREKVGNVLLYSLWLLFVAGLILPVFSTVLQDVTGGKRGRIESSVSIMNLVETVPINRDKAGVAVQQMEGTAEEKGKEKKVGDKAKRAEKDVEEGREPEVRAVKELSGDNGTQEWMKLLQVKYLWFFIWSVGAIIILLYQFWATRKFRRQLAESREEIYYQGQKVYVANGIKTPLLFRGRMFSSDIYLPGTIMEKETLVRHAILHENIHRKHGDIWWGYVRTFLFAVYWFYPLVWCAAILSKRDCEYACDSSVMKNMSRKERISYGNSLLSLIQIERKPDLFSPATAMKMKKSEMEARIRMIKSSKKRNIFITVFIMLVLCFAGVATFTDALVKDKELYKEQKVSSKPSEQGNTLSAKNAEYKLTDRLDLEVNELDIYYEDTSKMVFAVNFGLFIYSKEAGEIVQSLDLKTIGCNMTQRGRNCEIEVSEDGKNVYLHLKNDRKMYQYSLDTKELQHLDYKLPDKLYNRKKWEKKNQSAITISGFTIGDLVYWGAGDRIIYQPLFYQPYGTCEFFEPKDIKNLSEVSIYANGKEYVITDGEKLKWIEKNFSNVGKAIEGVPACPFTHTMYLKRKDGKCGKIVPATDSCAVYSTGESYYDYSKETNAAFWKLFGIEDMRVFRRRKI